MYKRSLLFVSLALPLLRKASLLHFTAYSPDRRRRRVLSILLAASTSFLAHTRTSPHLTSFTHSRPAANKQNQQSRERTRNTSIQRTSTSASTCIVSQTRPSQGRGVSACPTVLCLYPLSCSSSSSLPPASASAIGPAHPALCRQYFFYRHP